MTDERTTEPMAEEGRSIAAGLGRIALWLSPFAVIFEWVGGTFYKTMPMRVAYLASLLAVYWFSQPSSRVWRVERRWLRWTLGLSLSVVGVAIFSCAVWWLLGPKLGWQPFHAPDALSNEPSRLLAPLIAAWPLALGVSLCVEGEIGARAYQRLGAFLALGFLLHFAAQVHVQGLPVLARSGQRWLWAFAALALLLALVPRGPFALRLASLVAVGVGLRAFGLAAWEIDPRVRDMLALVSSAQERFLEGDQPYALYAMQHGSILPLTYLPGLWLGYGIPRLVGLDLRALGPFAETLLFASFAWVASRLDDARRPAAQALVFTFAATWFFSPSVQWNAIYAEPTWWWALLGMTLLYSLAGPYWLGALLLGLAIATRHFAIVLAPFLLLYFVRVRGLRGALPLAAIAAGTALLLLAPFAISEPELFWFGTLRWLREYGPAHITWFFDRFGFMQPFHDHQALHLLPYVQAAIVLACLVGAASLKRPLYIASFAATALLLFIMFNVLLWDSFLIDGAVSAAALAVTRPMRAQEPAVSEPTPRARYASLAVLGLAAVVGGYLVFTLVTSLHPRGRERAHDFMIARVRRGDVVIDRSDRRIAFVQGSWLLRREEVPAPIGGELFDPAWQGRSALHTPGRMWLVSQARRDEAMREDFAQLGRVEEDAELGDYRVQAVAPHAPRPAEFVVDGPEHVRRCAVGWSERELRAVVVRRGAPVRLRMPRAQRTLLFAAGFPNELVVWPREKVRMKLHGRDGTFAIENLFGMSWTALSERELPHGVLTLELFTDDPVGRELCLDLAWLQR